MSEVLSPAPWAAERLIPAWQDGPLDFLSIDALAAALVRQRPGRDIVLIPAVVTDGDRDWRGLSAWALRRADRRAFDADRLPFSRDYLGLSSGPRSGDFDHMTAALIRVRTAGGLAA